MYPRDDWQRHFLNGILIIHHDVAHIMLLNVHEIILEARSLGADQLIRMGDSMEFLRFTVRVPAVPLSPESLLQPGAGKGTLAGAWSCRRAGWDGPKHRYALCKPD
jgi:hypothetical protein